MNANPNAPAIPGWTQIRDDLDGFTVYLLGNPRTAIWKIEPCIYNGRRCWTLVRKHVHPRYQHHVTGSTTIASALDPRALAGLVKEY